MSSQRTSPMHDFWASMHPLNEEDPLTEAQDRHDLGSEEVKPREDNGPAVGPLLPDANPLGPKD